MSLFERRIDRNCCLPELPVIIAVFNDPIFSRFEYPTLPPIAPGRSVVSQSITMARPGDSMPRAQVTAWSERRSQLGASVVAITGSSSSGCRSGVVVVSTADHTDTDVYVPLFWHLTTLAAALPDHPVTSGGVLTARMRGGGHPQRGPDPASGPLCHRMMVRT